MKKNHATMLLEIQVATGLADHKLSLAMGMAPNWLCRIKNKPKWHCSAEIATKVEEWHTKHCKAMNPFAKQVMDIRSNSGLTDLQICQSIGCVCLNLEPNPEPRLRLPDGDHIGARIAGDHGRTFYKAWSRSGG